MFSKTVTKSQRALVFRDGEFQKLLMPGSYFIGPSSVVKYYSITEPFKTDYNFSILSEDKSLMAQLDVIDVADHEVVIRKENGAFKEILKEGKHLFWKSQLKMEFIRVNLHEPNIASDFDTSLFSQVALHEYIHSYTVGASDAGVLIVDDVPTRLLAPGNYLFWKNPNPASRFQRKEFRVEVFSRIKAFTPNRELSYYLALNVLANELNVVDILDHQIALHFEDEKFKNVLTVGKYAFWKNPVQHSFTVIDKNKPEIGKEIDPTLFSYADVQAHLWYFFVDAFEKGILILDKNFSRILEPGAYHFWKSPITPSVVKIDMRVQQLEVNGQEIMTRDKVALRINFVCQYKITDPLKIALEIKDYQAQLYMILQLALREYLGSQLLDEVLEKKEEISDFILNKIKTQATELGIEITWAGIKDVILPGDVKDILNQVLIAEKKAQANVVTRREETASTRSLLNTAKLMDENETLFKLKELEYIERISEKINQISLGGGSEMLEQLRALLMPKKK